MKKLSANMRLIVTLCILLVLIGCTNDKQAEKVVFDAEQLLNTNPDSAITILDDIKDRKSDWPKSQRMRYELVYAQAQNKAFIPFTTDSIVLKLADYYNHHGSPNEKMIANYMVGCAYRDLGDAPSALKYMNIAADVADKNNKNCNLSTLMGIHSQMGGLYQNVLAFDESLYEDSVAAQIAWQIEDTISALHLIWENACNLFTSNNRHAAIYLLDSINTFIHRNKLNEEPILIYPMKIEAMLLNQNITGANHLLHEYEQKTKNSPNCDDEELPDLSYLLYKGNYYKLVEHSDSAILMFRKLLNTVKNRNLINSEIYDFTEQAYRGLMESYSLRHETDSAIKYARMYCTLNDSSIRHHSSEQILRMQSLYNYTKIQERALKAERNSSDLRISILGLIILTIIASGFILNNYQTRLKKERQKQIDTNREYQHLVQEMDKCQRELHLFKTNSELFLKEKEIEISKLKIALNMFQPNSMNFEQWDNERLVLECSIAKHLHKLSAQGKKATVDELERLLTVSTSAFPQLHQVMDNAKLSDREVIICTLIRFFFAASEIATLMGHSSQRITNLKSSINSKLFKQPGAKTLEAHILSIK